MRRRPKSTKAGRAIVTAAKEILAHLNGEDVGVRVHKIWVVDVKEIRKELEMSQREFAEAYGIPLRTVQSWEQGARHPDATARSYLRTIASMPKQVRSALAKQS
jgi:putative transcriptional regulator